MFEIRQRANGLDMSFSSTLENIDRADKETKGFLYKMGIDSEAFAIRLVMREGTLNAVKHGNLGDSRKIIKYGLQLEENSIIIEIEDEGKGFDWSAHLGKEPALSSDSGRGLTIMRKYCTGIEYNPPGNRLVLRKEIGEREGEVLASEIAGEEDQAIVRPGRDIVASTAPAFRKKLLCLVEAGTKELVIDLAGVEMVDSDGLAALIDIHDSLREAGGRLTVTNVSKDIYDLFKNCTRILE